MAIVLTVLLIILSVIFRRSKFVAALFFLFMWLLWGWNSWNGDYDGYKLGYDYSTVLDLNNTYEVGYTTFTYFLKSLGLSFQSYMMLFSFIVLGIVFYCSLRNTKYPAFFALIYYMLFVLQFVFMRNYLSTTLMFAATLHAVHAVQNNKSGILTYIIVTLIASTLHVTSILYLIFIPAFTKKRINVKLILFPVILITLFVASGVNTSFLSLIPNFGDNVMGRMAAYSESLNEYASLKTTLFHSGFVALILYLNYKIPKHFIISGKDKIFNNVIVNINSLSLIYIIFYSIIPYLMRFIWFLLTIDALYLLFLFYITKNQQLNTKYRRLLVLSMLILITFILILIFNSLREYTLYALYNHNLIF